MGLLPILALVVANLLWSTSYAASKTLLTELSPQAVSFWRYSLAGVMLLPWLLPGIRRVPSQAWRNLLLMGVVSLVGGTVTQVAGMQRSLAANAALLVSLETVFAVVLAALFLKEGWSFWKGTSLGVAFIGVGLLNMAELTMDPSRFFAGWSGPYACGNLLLVISSLLFAFHILWSKDLTDSVSVMGLVGLPMLVASGTLLPFLGDGVLPRTWLGWGSVLYLGLVCTLLAYLLWMWGLKQIDAGIASLTLYLQPLGGALIGAFWLKEPLPPFFGWGACLIVVALLLANPPKSGCAAS